MSTSIANHITSPSLLPTLKTANTILQTATSIIDFLYEHSTTTSTASLQQTLLKQQKLLHALLSRLRTQSRRVAYEIRDVKAQTGEARQEVDRLLLQLQNLYYEQRHLLGEIASCEEYDHAYRHLPLVDVEEYIMQHPEDAGLDEEELMPRRIEFEGRERSRMEEERLELVKVKEALVKENARRKEEMRKIDERLEAWVEASAPIQSDLAKDL